MMATSLYPESPAGSTHAISAPSRTYRPRGTNGRRITEGFIGDLDSEKHSSESSGGNSRITGTTTGKGSKSRSASPSSVTQAFRTGRRARRQISRPEQASISRPEPLREDSAANLRKRRDDTRSSSFRGEEPKEGIAHAVTTTIEIEPGVMAPLRRAEETKQAIERGAFVTIICFGCETSLHCIDNAKFMICPRCRVVSPLLLDEGHGVGLGFTHETLVATMTKKSRRSRRASVH